jgi:hypothetical protein
MLSILMER